MAEGKFQPESVACFDLDAEVPLAVGEDGFKLRIVFEALRHVAHRRACGLVTGHVAKLILVLAGLAEFLPAFHEMVGAPFGGGAQFSFKLDGADSAVDLAPGASEASSGFLT